MSETLDNIVIINEGLRELDRAGTPHILTMHGRPAYAIHSLDPFARSRTYGRYHNRGPIIIGSVALKEFLIVPKADPEKPVWHAAIETGEKIYGVPLNLQKQGPRQVIYEVFENLGLDGWEIT